MSRVVVWRMRPNGAASIPKEMDKQIADAKGRNLSSEWLEARDEIGGFPTNGDRYAAQEIAKRLDTEQFNKKGFLLQAVAAAWHHKSAAQLKEIGDKVSRERIQIIHGTADRMIAVQHAEALSLELGPGVKETIFEGRAHVVPLEERRAFFMLIRDLAEKTEAMGRSP
jgi:hypothetical protein